MPDMVDTTLQTMTREQLIREAESLQNELARVQQRNVDVQQELISRAAQAQREEQTKRQGIDQNVGQRRLTQAEQVLENAQLQRAKERLGYDNAPAGVQARINDALMAKHAEMFPSYHSPDGVTNTWEAAAKQVAIEPTWHDLHPASTQQGVHVSTGHGHDKSHKQDNGMGFNA